MAADASLVHATPLGPVRIAGSKTGVREVSFDADAPPGDAGAEVPGPVRACAAQLDAYFAGARRAFDVPLAPEGTAFQRRVWEVLSRIPFGETRTYRDVAEAVGDAKAVRAVGLANGRNPLAIVVPCHRVVGSDGSLTGYAGGLDRKRWLLDHERRQVAGAWGVVPDRRHAKRPME